MVDSGHTLPADDPDGSQSTGVHGQTAIPESPSPQGIAQSASSGVGESLTVTTTSLPYHKLTGIDLDAVIDRVAGGEYVAHIATEYGCTPAALYMRLAHHPGYQQAKALGIEMRLDRGLIEIEAAGDDLMVARAREVLLRRLEWRAEREHPDRWGQRQTIVHEDVSDLGERLRRARGRVIDATPTGEQRATDVMLNAPRGADDTLDASRAALRTDDGDHAPG